MFNIDYKSQSPIYEQIIDQTVLFLMEGILEGGDQLPSVRELALSLGVNPNTVSKAYGELERRGYTENVVGKGTFIRKSHQVEKDLQNHFKESLRSLLEEMRRMGLTNDYIQQLVTTVLKEEENVTDTES
ncbi:MAG: GntR family transcriptional regulator [Erysipelothrix sp.]|nr:GntR family transcriptional regulator [Erysipelothrix sp.]